MSNETSTKSTTDRTAGAKRHHVVGAKHHRTAGAKHHHEVDARRQRIARIRAAYPSLTGGEAGVALDIADDILRHAQRHRSELAVVLAEQPVTDGPPIDRPEWCVRTKTTVQGIYDHMFARDANWVSMHDVADALGIDYEKIKYLFAQMKKRGHIIRGPDRKRPGGGSGIHQYRLARKEQAAEVGYG